MGWQDAPIEKQTKNAWESAPIEQPAQPAENLSRFDKFAQGMRDPIDAGAQLLTEMLPDSVVNAGNRLNNFIADNTGLVARLPDGGVNQQISQNEADYQRAREAQGESGIDGYRLFGNFASPANLAIASKIPVAATLGGRVASGAAYGGASAVATQPVYSNDARGKINDFVALKTKQAAIGALAGGAIPVLASGVSRIVKPQASSNPQIQLLQAEGVTPTIGQTFGGKANLIEDKLQSIPIMGDMIKGARSNANSQFQSAAYNRALAPIGEKLPSGISGREALNFTESKLKDAYDNVLTRIGAIKPDQEFSSKVSSLSDLVNRTVMPQADKDKFAYALSKVNSSIDQNGVITSEAYKSLESVLGTDARKLAIGTPYEADIGNAVKQLQQELRDMLSRQAGSKAKELQQVNTGWANFKRTQNAASKLGADNGEFTPAQYQNAVKAMDKSKDKGAFARGSALGQDLGDAGKAVLTGKVPNSGTADRLLLGTGALSSYAINPAIPATLLAGAALYSKPVQNMIVNAVTRRPELAEPIAKLISESGNKITPAATAGMLQFLHENGK